MKQEQVYQILNTLEQMYPNAECELVHSNAFELLIATILSAQCTDQRVNQITVDLFKKYKAPIDYTKVSEEQIAMDIYGLGLYKNKSRAIKKTAHILTEEYGGQIPGDRESLERLPGVGRKTANVVLSNAFQIPAIAVDTHVFRVSHRLGLASGKNVLETEQQLMAIIPKERWSQTHHQLIFHGRRLCHARKPKCIQCQLAVGCPSKQ